MIIIVKNPRAEEVAFMCPWKGAIPRGGGFKFPRLNVK